MFTANNPVIDVSYENNTIAVVFWVEERASDAINWRGVAEQDGESALHQAARKMDKEVRGKIVHRWAPRKPGVEIPDMDPDATYWMIKSSARYVKA